MKALILGATGIIGQHLRFHQPARWDVAYIARNPAGLPWVEPYDLFGPDAILPLLKQHFPDVVINLAGQASTDAVESNPDAYRWVNVELPRLLAQHCHVWRLRFIHASSQGALGGNRAPYPSMLQSLEPDGEPIDFPVNRYGWQKREAEWAVVGFGSPFCWVARLTFILGVRPFPNAGRPNPLEQAFAAADRQRLVADRWFSPCLATQAAEGLWRMAKEAPEQKLINIGIPARLTRADIGRLAWMAKRAGGAARLPGVDLFSDTAGPAALVEELKHDDAFPQLAQRPKDTTFAFSPRDDAYLNYDLTGGVLAAARQWRALLDINDRFDRAAEIGGFLGMSHGDAAAELALGFPRLSAEVANDYRRSNPRNDAELLNWYRRTNAYIWELTAYHLDEGFNYSGMCKGIRDYLLAWAASQAAALPADQEIDTFDVLCLGDGVGDLTLALHEGKPPRWQIFYHDLQGSQTAAFAEFRFHRRCETGGKKMPNLLTTSGWEPPAAGRFDAIVALDFFEHLTDVEGWVAYVARALKPGGRFMAQNAFAQGDEEHGGSFPMHLSRNNKYADADPDPAAAGRALWDSVLLRAGLERGEGGWWRKPVEAPPGDPRN